MKRFLSIALAVMMIMSMFVIPVSSAGTVVEINMKTDKTYKTISQAIAAVPDGGEGVIKIPSSTYTENITIPAGKKITINGAANVYGTVTVNGELIAKGSVWFIGPNVVGSKVVTVNQGAKLTVSNAYIGDKASENAGYAIGIYNNGGEVVFDKGNLESKVNYGNRYLMGGIVNKAGTTTINGGKITSEQFAIQVLGGEVIINGGYIEPTRYWGDQVIEVTGGKLTINGGYISAITQRGEVNPGGVIRRVEGEVIINGGYYTSDKYLVNYLADDVYLADYSEKIGSIKYSYEVKASQELANASIEIEEFDAVTYERGFDSNTMDTDAKNATLRVISKVNYEGDLEIEKIGTKIVPTDKLASGKWATIICNDMDIANGETFSADLTNIAEDDFDREFSAVSFVKFKGYKTIYSAQSVGTVEDLATDIGVKRTLQCDEDGNFTILLVADPQYEMHSTYIDARDELERLIQKSNPDYVLINGDIDNLGKFGRDEFKMFIEPLESRNIPWSTTNGNHDEYDIANDRVYRGYANNINETLVTENIPYYAPAWGRRKTNYAQPIYANNGEDVVFVVYGMDSGNSTPLGYDTLEEWQMTWYKEQSNFFKEMNGGTPITSIMAYHIPTPEFIDLWCARKDAGTTDPNVHGPRGDMYEVYGYWDEIRLSGRTHTCRNGTVVSSSSMGATVDGNNRGLFDLVKAQGDVKGMFFGHTHDINYIGSLEGILLGCVGKLGPGRESSATRNRGGRVIEFNQVAPEDFVTYWIPANDLGTDGKTVDPDQPTLNGYANYLKMPTESQPAIHSDGTLAE